MSTDTSTIPLKQRLAARGLDGLTLLVLPVLYRLAHAGDDSSKETETGLTR